LRLPRSANAPCPNYWLAFLCVPLNPYRSHCSALKLDLRSKSENDGALPSPAHIGVILDDWLDKEHR
jgi:hypothetical protein